MKPMIGVQLYSVREQLAADYEGTIRKIASMGYDDVEPAGFPGTTPEKAAKLFRELGLKSVSMHGELPVGDATSRAIEAAQTVGVKYIISGKGPADFQTVDAIKKTAELFNEAAANAAKHGLKIGYHNHDWEMFKVDGKPGYGILKEHLSKDVIFEIDTYWVTVGGLQAPELIKEMGERSPVLHMKDGPCVKGEPMLAVGKGRMDFAPIIKAATHAEALIVELDFCATDMLEAVKESRQYLSSRI